MHLDHFHAYEASRKLENGYISDAELNVADLSLELHTDNGLMIAMIAPAYFEVLPTGELQLKQTQGQDAGLFIQLGNGEIVRPVLNPDELILMLGSGIDDWIKTSPPLHSVLHGMRYPRTVSVVNEDGEGNKLLRSWFGKMILLEEHQVMDNTGLTFGQYANQTTRYLMQQDGEDHQAFGAVACPRNGVWLHRTTVARSRSVLLRARPRRRTSRTRAKLRATTTPPPTPRCARNTATVKTRRMAARPAGCCAWRISRRMCVRESRSATMQAPRTNWR